MSESHESPESVWAQFPNPVEKSLSVFGTKTLSLTHAGELLLEDSGGLGAAVKFTLPIDSEAHRLYAPKRSRRIRGLAHFGQDVWAAFELPSEPPDFWLKLREHLSSRPSSDFDSLIHLSCSAKASKPENSTSDFPVMPDLLLKAAKKKPLALTSEGKTFSLSAEAHLHLSTWLNFYRQESPNTERDFVLYELTQCREFYARVFIEQGRLVLERGSRIAQIPLDILNWTYEKKSLRFQFQNQLVLAGILIDDLSIDFVSSDQAEQFLQQLPEAPQGNFSVSSSLSEIVHLQGLLAQGKYINDKVDCRLQKESVEFRDLHTGLSLILIDLSALDCRAAGTKERFVLFSEHHGPLAVSEGAESFQQRVLDHRLLQRAAKTNRAQGPFLLRGRQTDTVFHLETDHLRLRGSDVSEEILYSSVTGMNCCHQDDGKLVFSLAQGTTISRFSGELEQVRGLHLALRKLVSKVGGEQKRETLCRRILGFEGDYLLYTIFSPFYHTQRLLEEGPHGDSLSTDQAMEQLVLLSQACVNILRHLRMVTDFLPTFISNRDLEILGSTNDPRESLEATKVCKNQEAGLRRAFLQVQSLQGPLHRVSSVISNKTGFRATNPDYGPLAISLVGASLFSPICLLAGAQHAYNASTRGAKQEKEQQAAVSETLEQATAAWTELTEEHIPLLSYHLVESVFPIRRHWAKFAESYQGGDPTGISERLLERYITLDLFFGYPEDASMGYRRSDIIESIKQARQVLNYEPFHNF